MRREVFGQLDEDLRIPESQCFFPHPFRIDEISDKIQQLGGIDVCYGGIGYHGHVAFNEPPISR
jgi:glucosamine-6-phosphate deaminase